MLEFKNIKVNRGKRSILQGISFALSKSGITVLLGKNGSGKSTLLDAVTGQVKYSGSITLDGREVSKMPSRSRASEIALLPQTLPETSLTVRDLVSLGRYAYTGSIGVLSEEELYHISSAIRTTGLTNLADRPCNELSGGERQKAYFAMILAQNSTYLLLDEPTTYLDISYRREMYSLMHMLAVDHGKSLLVVMHDLSEAVALADRICVLDGGRVAFTGTRDEFLAGNIYENVFGVKQYKADDKIFFA